MNMAALITRTISLLLDVLIVVVAFVAPMSVKLVFFMVELVYEIIQLILVSLWYFVYALLLVLSKLGTIAQMIQSAGVFLCWSFKVLSLLTSYLLLIGSHLLNLIKKIPISDGLVAVVKLVTTMSVKLFSSWSRLLWNIRLRLNF